MGPSAPAGETRIAVEGAFPRAASTGVTTHASILAVLRNDGSSSVELPASSTRYEVADADGGVAAAGVFTYLIPNRLAPGARAYAVEVMPALFVGPDALGAVVVEPVARTTGRLPAPMSVSELEWTVGTDGAVSAQGRVTNDTGQAVSAGFVAVVFLDARGNPLALVYDLVDVALLGPGESRTFSTDYPRSVSVRAADIARVETFAYDLAGQP